jgi:prepilin-type N-terminal cleavage/methylation domain-containing protein/prepilin-type processing-associated H-X9-DG protein
MKRVPSTDSRKGFTLLELMLVVFVIAILAALLLPVLSKAKGRAKQIDCLSQLRQVGLAAQQFAHEHNGRFPFQISVKEGGTLELVQAALGLGDVQYAFRHFQALSNDLDNPKLLACPADKRITTNAVNFAWLRNEHISYFMAVTADYSRPESLLAGDRNIIARGGNSGSILRLAADTEVAWTGECHEYKGNLLFAGGHVERTGKGGLQVAMQDPTGPVNAWIPTASSSGSASPSSSGGSGASAAGGAGGAGGGSKGGRSSGGAGASGFAALQNFFQSPSSGGSATPAPTPPTPAKTVDAAVPESPVAIEHPSVAFPDPPPRSRTNQIATFASPITTAPAAEPATAWIPEAPPGMLAIFVEPERCWWCWVLFLIVCVAAAMTLGVLIQRRQQRRLRAASAADRPSAS